MPLAHIKYEDIISLENLFLAWREFLRGKRKKKDVAEFSVNLLDNIISLHNDLKNKTYRHGAYSPFKVNDPKPRDIHKASVRDRLLHRAIYRTLYPYFDRKFIFDSFSCRRRKGTHKALKRFRYYGNIVSKNNTKTVWVLKSDVKKFFASIDQKILIEVLKKYIDDEDVILLLEKIIVSFYTNTGKGLPLGNLTSQLLVNAYMNEFDHFVKRNLKVKHYIHYSDDFVILHEDKNYLQRILPKISNFLEEGLKLSLHPDKVFIKTLFSGLDFLGWVHFSNHRVLRTATKKRVIKRFNRESKDSYMGLLSHGNTYKIIKKLHF